MNFIMFIQRYKVYFLFLKHKWIQLKQTEISIYSNFHILVCFYAALFWLKLNIHLLVIWRGLNTALKCSKKFQFDQESSRPKTTLWMCYLQIILSFFLSFFNTWVKFHRNVTVDRDNVLNGSRLFWSPRDAFLI